jgi:amino acid transporter
MTDSSGVRDEGLVRVIGTGALGLGVVNMVVGAGIFALPGLVAAELGPAAIVAYLICSVTVALVFLCFAEVGSRVSRSGGAYAYVEEAFGPFVGFIASTLLWFGFTALADAAITVVMVDSIAILFPILGESIPRAVFIIAILVFLAAVNVRGVQSGVRLYVFNTLAKLVPLLLLLGAGHSRVAFRREHRLGHDPSVLCVFWGRVRVERQRGNQIPRADGAARTVARTRRDPRALRRPANGGARRARARAGK